MTGGSCEPALAPQLLTPFCRPPPSAPCSCAPDRRSRGAEWKTLDSGLEPTAARSVEIIGLRMSPRGEWEGKREDATSPFSCRCLDLTVLSLDQTSTNRKTNAQARNDVTFAVEGFEELRVAALQADSAVRYSSLDKFPRHLSTDLDRCTRRRIFQGIAKQVQVSDVCIPRCPSRRYQSRFQRGTLASGRRCAKSMTCSWKTWRIDTGSNSG